MTIKPVALALSALGALMIVFGVLMWGLNKPDLSAGSGTCDLLGRPGSSGYEYCRKEFARNIETASSAYGDCLFRTRTGICATVTTVPYLNIGGILLLVSGMGLFAFGAMTSTAKP